MKTRVLLALIGALVLAAARPAAAAPLQEVGDEVAAGKNATGEECRLRLLVNARDRIEYRRYNLYCEGWTAASGEIRRFRVARETTPEKLLTAGVWHRQWSARQVACGPVGPTQILAVSTAALRECKREDGGWPVVVAVALVGSRAYTFETFPTNLRVLERAAEVIGGKRAAADAEAPGGTLSAAIRRAEALVGASGKLIGVQDMGAADGLWRLGKLYLRSGNDPAAEAAFRRLYEVYERLLGAEPPGGVAVLEELGIAVARQRRFEEAERIYARAEAMLPRSHSVDDQPRLLAYRAWTATYLGRYDDAARLARESLALREPRGPETGPVAHSLAALAYPLRWLGRLDESRDTAERALRIFEKPGEDPDWRMWWAGEMYHLLGVVLRDQRRFAEAQGQLELALRRANLLFGDSARSVDVLRDLGANARMGGDVAGALRYLRRAAEVVTKNRAARARPQTGLTLGYLQTLGAAAAAAPADRPALLAEALVAAQLLRTGGTARAVQAMSARAAAADAALGMATRALQDGLRRRDGLRYALARETVKPQTERDAGREESLKGQLREAEEKAEALEIRLQAQFPRYASLSAETPLTAAEVGALLRPAEGLLVLVPGAEETWVLLARGREVHLHRAPISLRDLGGRVRALRSGIEIANGSLRGFDLTTAHQLHDLLLAPLRDRLAGTAHLLVVPGGPLLSLPLGLLVTKPPAAGAGDDYRAAAWLARNMAISVLPSVASLRSLRAVAGPSPAPRPFIGFGDPVLGGATRETRAVAGLAALCREAGPVDPALLRRLPRLPETARELALIARALGAEASSVVVGAEATETRVRGMDLGQYRAVAFATHGVLPSELGCQAEAALVLTPPAVASATDDGLLDASEVVQLRLDADWVLLSACNTAGPDGRLGGESLSGLTRAFFYAGARAVLATHWAVESRATVQLTTGMLGVYAREPALGRAEALRRSQMALAGEAATSHPFYWAPFVLVGDGGGGS